MKSPNASSTSRVKPSLASDRKSRVFRSSVALLLICPFVFVACQTAQSGRTDKSKGDNPYSKYDPKTPEEEEYYRDVYSGDWSEDSEGGLVSVYKHSGSTTLPKHWRSMPPGAKTLEEIRYDASQRKMAEMRSGGYSTPSQSSGVAPSSSPSSQTTYSAPAPSSTANPYAPTSAPLAQPYAAAYPAGSGQNVYAQSPASQTAQGSGTPEFVAQAPTTQGQNVEFVARAPAQTQTQTPAPNAPQTVAPQPNGAPAVYPQAPRDAYPSSSVSASVDLFDSAKWLIRGQEPEEDDPFADESDDDPFSEDEENSASVDSETAESEVANPAAATPEASAEATPAVDVTDDNVTATSVTPEARASDVVVQPAEQAGSNEPVGFAVRIGGRKMILKIDPSIAEPFAKLRRPKDSTPTLKTDKGRKGYDEYVISGGDSKEPVVSREDWSVENLDSEDSVAHFDTMDGRILTEPSNRIFLYSPRFGAVRQVVGPIEGDHREGIEIANTNEGALQGDDVRGVDVRSNESRPLGANSALQAQGAETSVGVVASSGLQGVMEGDAQVRLGATIMSETIDDLSSEDAGLMLSGALAAQGWSGEQGVAVSTDLVNAFSNAYSDGAATIYQIKDDTKTSKLRVIKIANKDSAKPGEFVEFTIRFENIGDQPIGNVTILDNLSPRLRYVDGTAQSSMLAELLADLNEKGSLNLRWEIEKPLYPKEFGVVRFICKVQ